MTRDMRDILYDIAKNKEQIVASIKVNTDIITNADIQSPSSLYTATEELAKQYKLMDNLEVSIKGMIDSGKAASMDEVEKLAAGIDTILGLVENIDGDK